MNTNEKKVVIEINGEQVEVTPTNITTLLQMDSILVAADVTLKRREFSKEDWIKINDAIIDYLNIGRDPSIPPYTMNIYGVSMTGNNDGLDDDPDSDSYRTIMSSKIENDPIARIEAVADLWVDVADKFADHPRPVIQEKETATFQLPDMSYAQVTINGEKFKITVENIPAILDKGGPDVMIAIKRAMPQFPMSSEEIQAIQAAMIDWFDKWLDTGSN